MLIFVIILFFGLAFLGQADAAASNGSMPDGKVYLVVMSTTNTGNRNFTSTYHEVSNMTQCFQLIKNSRIEVSHGGDAESAVVMYCTPTKGKDE